MSDPKRVKQEKEYVFFWQAWQVNGRLSNWSLYGVRDKEDVFYRTLEHYLMYHKAMTMGDKRMAKNILVASTPGRAKVLGRQVKFYDENKWRAMREDIMYSGLLLKVAQHPDVKKLLMETGDKIIAEASPLDAIWGIGCEATNDEEKWKGLNLLGKAWMRVRDHLQNEVKKTLENGSDLNVDSG